MQTVFDIASSGQQDTLWYFSPVEFIVTLQIAERGIGIVLPLPSPTPQYLFAEGLTLLGEKSFHFLKSNPVPVFIPYLKWDSAAIFND